MKRGRSAAAAEPPPRETVSRTRMAIALAAIAALVVEGMLESLSWPRVLWGSHFFAFLPRAWMLLAPAALLLATPLAGRIGGGAGEARVPKGRWWLPWVAGAAAGAWFWVLRERHQFWGDGTALAVNVPQGQAFHPDEPLTLFMHHLLYRMFGGQGPAVPAIALGSALCGALFVGWTVHWFSKRLPRGLWPLAALALIAQGFTQIFYGHVENYGYLAVCLLVFFTTGIDALEGRAHPIVPLLAATLAFAFHILGALALVPALVLIVHGLRLRDTRGRTVLAIAAVALAVAIGAWLAAPLYDGDSPFSRVVSGVFKVLANPTDMRPEHAFTLRHLQNVWSEFMLLGPLSVPLVAALLLALPARRLLPGAVGAFLALGAATYFGVSLLTGEGNLGAARNWDLFSAPSTAPALLGLVLVTWRLEAAQARRLLIALVAVSLFHTAPWVALNADFERTVDRVAALPLGNARGETMIGTHFLNAGDLPRAETWFATAVRNGPLNPNAQSGLGLALARQGKLEEAVAPMTAATRLKPESLQLRYDLITLLLSLDRWEPAARQLEAAVALSPTDRKAWMTLAGCRMNLGQPDSAAMVLEAALTHLPGDPELRAALADAYRKTIDRYRERNDLQGALRVLERYRRAFPQESGAAPAPR